MKTNRIGLLIILVVILSTVVYVFKSYYKFQKLKTDEAFETYYTLSVGLNVLSFYEKELNENGLNGFIVALEQYSNENNIQYFTNLLNYLKSNKDFLNFHIVPDSNALIIYHFGPNYKDDSLKKEVTDYSKLTFTDYLFRKDNDVIVTYVLK